MYFTDEKGEWAVDGNCKMLINPSESYFLKRGLENQAQDEQELINSLIPSEKEMLVAEVEIQTITILMEVGLI